MELYTGDHSQLERMMSSINRAGRAATNAQIRDSLLLITQQYFGDDADLFSIGEKDVVLQRIIVHIDGPVSETMRLMRPVGVRIEAFKVILYGAFSADSTYYTETLTFPPPIELNDEGSKEYQSPYSIDPADREQCVLPSFQQEVPQTVQAVSAPIRTKPVFVVTYNSLSAGGRNGDLREPQHSPVIAGTGEEADKRLERERVHSPHL